jgi:hypothetical protein
MKRTRRKIFPNTAFFEIALGKFQREAWCPVGSEESTQSVDEEENKEVHLSRST